MRLRLLAFPLALIAGLGLSSTDGTAQSIAVHRITSSSGSEAFSSPVGFGGSLTASPLPFLRVRAHLYRQAASFPRTTQVCVQYEPTPTGGCRTEAVETSATLAGTTLLALLVTPVLPGVTLEAGAGASLSSMRVGETTESGRASNLFAQNTGQLGTTLHVGSRIRPLPVLPLAIDIGYGLHSKDLRACSPDAWRYTPYCGKMSLRELRLGLAVDF
jgi:hypothetical protein